MAELASLASLLFSKSLTITDHLIAQSLTVMESYVLYEQAKLCLSAQPASTMISRHPLVNHVIQIVHSV